MHPVLKLVAQRLALGILLLLAASVLIFVGTEILPGDVAQCILGQSATPEVAGQPARGAGPERTRPGPLFQLAGRRSARRSGHRADQWAGHRRPRSACGSANTLFLAFWAAVISVPLAILLGLLAVRYRNRWPDKLISGVTLASISMPEFFIGYVLIYFFAVKLALVPVGRHHL